MTEATKAAEQKETETAKVSVKVTADTGVTFARKHYAKGESITCTPGQAKILKAQRVTE
jgi:hypothetical protein